MLWGLPKRPAALALAAVGVGSLEEAEEAVRPRVRPGRGRPWGEELGAESERGVLSSRQAITA